MTPHAKELIKNVPLFAGAEPDELLRVLGDCETKEFEPGEYICREGEYDDTCSIVLSGTVNVEMPRHGAPKAPLVTLGAGEVFGEIAAMTGNPRTVNVIVSTPTTLLNIPGKKLFTLIDRFPSVKNTLDGLYRQRALRSHLLACHILSAIPAEVLEKLAERVTLHTYRKGEVIFNQGDEADAFYLVRYGFVKVEQKTDGVERVLAYLKEGHFFGEMALLKEGEKRMATLSAINRAELIRISKKDFLGLVAANPAVTGVLEEIEQRRVERNLQLAKDAYFESSLSSLLEYGIIQTKALLIMDLTKCIQCDNCVKACAALHGNNPRLVRKGTRLNNILLIPTSCRHCEDPACMSKCPTGAITRAPDGEIYHKDFCIGCGNCARNCPYGNISIVALSEERPGGGFMSRIFGTISRGNGAGAAEHKKGDKAEAPKRFVFPGDRDMVERDPSKRLPGDYDMAGTDAKTVTPTAKKVVRARKRAVKCDMCRDYDYLGCVYNCPRGAARRVNPTEFFAEFDSLG